MLKSSNLLTYTGASLAAISLVYIFGPIVFPSYRYEGGSKFSEKPSYDGVVGLTNIANECYINSVLQALAASSRFRNFLAEELHRRRSNGLEVRPTMIIYTNFIKEKMLRIGTSSGLMNCKD